MIACSPLAPGQAMQRYFFHVRDGEVYEDLQGTLLEDLSAARAEAMRFAGALLGDIPEKFWSSGEWHMTVTDEMGLTKFQLTFVATESPAIHQ